jgi:hypothetical protein
VLNNHETYFYFVVVKQTDRHSGAPVEVPPVLKNRCNGEEGGVLPQEALLWPNSAYEADYVRFRGLYQDMFRGLCQDMFRGLCQGMFRGLCQDMFRGLYRDMFWGLCQLCSGWLHDCDLKLIMAKQPSGNFQGNGGSL